MSRQESKRKWENELLSYYLKCYVSVVHFYRRFETGSKEDTKNEFLFSDFVFSVLS